MAESRQRLAIDITPMSVIWVLAIGGFAFFLYQVRSIIALLFLSFIVMVALNPFVTFLQRKFRFPRAVSTAFVYLAMISLLAILLGAIIPPLAGELYQLLKAIEIPGLQQVVSEIKFTISELSVLADRVGSSVGLVMSVITSTFSSLFTFFTLIVLSFYLMVDRENLPLKVAWFSKDKQHIELARKFLSSVELQLGGWVRGQIILMTLIGVVTYTGLVLLGVPYAVPLAVLAGLLEILPNLGPTMAAVPAIILAYLNGGPIFAGIILLFYVVIQQLENSVLVPKVMKANADVNPLIAIVAILVGLQMGGVLGALLAVPVYIVVRTMYAFFWLGRVT